MTGPYAEAASRYLEAGWSPLPVRGKYPPPNGYTGRGGHVPSQADVLTWATGDEGGRNVGLRVPPTVLGVDVDAYGDKPGADTLARLVAECGPLPETATSTNRDDGASCIRFYRVPAGYESVGGLPGIEFIQHHHRYAMVWPSIHPEGRTYRWVDADWRDTGIPRVDELAALPRAWLDRLRHAHESATGKADLPDVELRAKLAAWCREGEPCRHVAGKLAEARTAMAGKESRHDSCALAQVALVRLGEAGHPGAGAALESLRAAFHAALGAERDGSSEWNRGLAGAVRLIAADPTPEHEKRCRAAGTTTGAPVGAAGDPAPALAELFAVLNAYQDLPDPAHVLAVLAVAATADLDDEPAWLLLVAPPSSGKTEAVRLLDDIADAHLNEVTAAGLLGWSKQGKKPRPTGVLSRVGPRPLLTFGDLSSLLATSDRGGRDQVFSLLRRVYDGEATRDIGAPSGAPVDKPLSWSGRATVIAAVTGAIDRYAAHADALGPRWVYYRLPERGTAAKRAAARRARRGGLDERRERARELAAAVVAAGRARAADVEISDALADAIEDAALVTCWGRAVVPRHGYGRREIDGMATVEEPPRLIRQLSVLARGLLALGLAEAYVTDVARRVALDSMPPERRAVLDTLARVDDANTAQVARFAGLDRGVARRTLEELDVIGVVREERHGPEPDDGMADTRPAVWALNGEDGQLIADVISIGRCSEMWVPTPPLPPSKRADQRQAGEGTHVSEHPSAEVSDHRKDTAA